MREKISSMIITLEEKSIEYKTFLEGHSYNMEIERLPLSPISNGASSLDEKNIEKIRSLVIGKIEKVKTSLFLTSNTRPKKSSSSPSARSERVARGC